MAAVLFRLTSVPVFDSNGTVVSGALATFYLTGTLTKTPVYQNDALTIAHTNPVEANSAGVLPPIYLDSDITYRVRVTDADGVLIDDSDPYRDLAAEEILAKLLTVDGQGSGLDADRVRGVTPSTAGMALLIGTMPQLGLDGANITITPNRTGHAIRNINSVSRTATIQAEASGAWPANAFFFAGSLGAGSLVIARDTGVSLFLAGTDKNVTVAAGGFAVVHRQSANSWYATGSGLS